MENPEAGDSNGGKAQTGSAPRYGVVAAVLLVCVALLLGGGYVLGQRLRPRAGPAGVSAATATSSSASPSADSGGPGTSASAMPSRSGPAVAAASPETSSAAEQQVIEAYLRYWQVYSDAVLNLDTSHLNEVLAGPALQWVTDEVTGLKEKNTPAKVNVQHNYAVVRLGDTTATLVDNYVSQSVYVDPKTRQPLPRTDPPTHVEQSFDFQKVDGVWKIVGGNRTVQSASAQP